MKKLFALAVVSTVLVVSCKSKTVATAETKTTTVKKEISAVDYAMGKDLFESKCGKCHDLPKPTEYSAEKWVGIMKSMAPKAKLDEKQSTLVYDYVTNYKK
ncbi:MAG: cytochrome C [Bacteroidetes bacterium]|nr:cytochrome C [Bacteroidota bacterium]